MTTIRTTQTLKVHLVIIVFAAMIVDRAATDRLWGAETEVLADIAYKPNVTNDYERERCKLDLYLPADREGFPTLVWFHGGGLQNGHKADDIAVGLARRFSSEGIAVACANYRLSPKVKYPAYIDDAAAAVAFVSSLVPSYGGSSERIYVSGHSAGGYLTAMIGTDSQYLAKYGIEADSIAGYIPVSGQMITHSTVRGERNIDRAQPIVDAGAPLFHVGQNKRPFLCLAGDADLPARAEENRYFVAAMKAAGHTAVWFREVADRDHGTIASRISERDDEVAAAIKHFMASTDHTHRSTPTTERDTATDAVETSGRP